MQLPRPSIVPRHRAIAVIFIVFIVFISTK
jgi:hypothetical protein